MQLPEDRTEFRRAALQTGRQFEVAAGCVFEVDAEGKVVKEIRGAELARLRSAAWQAHRDRAIDYSYARANLRLGERADTDEGRKARNKRKAQARARSGK